MKLKLIEFFIFFNLLFFFCSPNKQIKEEQPDIKTEKNSNDIPLYAANSPFSTEYNSPVEKKRKRLWARSALWQKAPSFKVEKWITDEPEIKGKYLLLEFWATWCSQCKKATPRLNKFHNKYKDEMAVIGITDESEEKIKNFDDFKMEYYIATDTQARMKDELGVRGIPHVIIVEPEGYIVWEGFPLLKNHELTEEIIEKILAVGRTKK